MSETEKISNYQSSFDLVDSGQEYPNYIVNIFLWNKWIHAVEHPQSREHAFLAAKQWVDYIVNNMPGNF